MTHPGQKYDDMVLKYARAAYEANHPDEDMRSFDINWCSITERYAFREKPEWLAAVREFTRADNQWNDDPVELFLTSCWNKVMG